MNTEQIKYSDQDLFLFVKTERIEYFDYIYENYSPILYGFLLNSALSEKNSSDILQQTFVKLWTLKTEEISPGSNFLCYLIKILMDTIKDYLQTNNRKFTINLKNSSSISIEFTDILQPQTVKHCSA
ncbi:RNA polymerase sigma factor [Chryseobacterium sp. GP-SGM7]|uniref:RNA polymerase sigma factor n=1 Tax=Chryseobacterium sp. GP-SGM7 TaxID=3411323 RepID=UPI003B9656D1